MSIRLLKFNVEDGLQKEIDFFAGAKDDARKAFLKLNQPSTIKSHVEGSYEYLDIVSFAKTLSPSRVLDVGVAYGITSFYLALMGHKVTAVEPSLEMCREMDEQAKRTGIPLDVVNGTAEVLDQLKPKFDAVVFYSSLHHCDDPRRALQNAYGRLEEGGTVFLFEPVLKFYRSKKWYGKMLEINPEKIGHYGGNEHIYRFREYTRFLNEMGFKNITAQPSATYSHIPKKAIWDNSVRYWFKKRYFETVQRRVLMGGLSRFLKPILFRLSLLNPVITATK